LKAINVPKRTRNQRTVAEIIQAAPLIQI